MPVSVLSVSITTDSRAAYSAGTVRAPRSPSESPCSDALQRHGGGSCQDTSRQRGSTLPAQSSEVAMAGVAGWVLPHRPPLHDNEEHAPPRSGSSPPQRSVADALLLVLPGLAFALLVYAIPRQGSTRYHNQMTGKTRSESLRLLAPLPCARLLHIETSTDVPLHVKPAGTWRSGEPRTPHPSGA